MAIKAGLQALSHRQLFPYICAGVLIVGCLVLALSCFRNRMRYREVAMADYYSWAAELRLGGKPWNPESSAATRPLGIERRAGCNYPPPFLVAFEPLTLLPVKAAYWLWQTILIGSLAAAVVLLVREIFAPTSKAPYLLALGTTLLFPEGHSALYESEPTFLLLLLIVVAWACDRRERPLIAALMLALAAAFKVFPAALLGYFFCRRSWRVVLYTGGFLVVIVLLSGLDNWVWFARFGVLKSQWVSEDAWLVKTSDRSIAVMAQARALLDWLNGGPLGARMASVWVLVTAVVDFLLVGIAFETCRGCARKGADWGDLCFGVWVMVSILISPISWAHYLIFTLPLGFGLLRALLTDESVYGPPAAIFAGALAAIAVAHFSVPIRHLHVFFLGSIAIFLAGVLAARSERVGRSRNEIAGELREPAIQSGRIC
jgi:hypothetical protein